MKNYCARTIKPILMKFGVSFYYIIKFFWPKYEGTTGNLNGWKKFDKKLLFVCFFSNICYFTTRVIYLKISNLIYLIWSFITELLLYCNFTLKWIISQLQIRKEKQNRVFFTFSFFFYISDLLEREGIEIIVIQDILKHFQTLANPS